VSIMIVPFTAIFSDLSGFYPISDLQTTTVPNCFPALIAVLTTITANYYQFIESFILKFLIMRRREV